MVGLIWIRYECKMPVNDQKPSYMSEKTTLNDLRPVTLNKKIWYYFDFYIKNMNYRKKTHF